ncbi:MAG TPA: hypothetical protein VF458_18280 [Ktedonobacteraceae bacterium]
MYSREDKDQLPDQDRAQPEAPFAGKCPGISTERIMQAVEEQRRVSQQLEDLRFQQKQRTAHLRQAGLKLMGVLWCITGALAGGFILLLLLVPALLDRTLNSLDDSIAFLVVLAEQIKMGLSLIPSSSWLLSVAALAVVLMMGLWIRLMRHPQDA